jgi:hypothetical protein
VQRPFAKYLRAAAAMIAGLALGLAATAVSLRTGYGFGAMRVGPWTAWPQIGGADIDPYARAMLSRSGEAPLGREQGLAFIARADSSGERLDGRCEYRILDQAPPARFWTLSVAAPSGALLANLSGRHVFTSADILRREGGDFEIAVANSARAGNWLAIGAVRDFVLVLRLYDTPFDVDARHEASSFPRIVKTACA